MLWEIRTEQIVLPRGIRGDLTEMVKYELGHGI